MAGKLTAKQKAFVAEYLVDLNATEAALRAGYSPKTAGQIGHENLKKPEIEAAVGEERKARQKRTQITADKVLEQYGRMAFFDFRQLYDESGRLRSVREWPEEATAAVAGIESIELAGDVDGVIRKVRFVDKRAALADIAKHLGMFVDKVDLRNIDPPKVEIVLNAPRTAPKTE